MHLLDFRQDDPEYVDSLRSSFAGATPFPYVVLHDVLNLAVDEVTLSFPDLDWEGWETFDDSYQLEKRFCGDIERIPDLMRRLIYELEAPSFLQFLSAATGIENLIPDPYLVGGGLHCTGPGGRLVPHTDFHVYKPLNLYRQVNVLLYLNPNWTGGDGGELQLFQVGDPTPVVNVAPTFGTCVIFRTDHQSVHGVCPVRDGASPRRSIAMYYYTSTENEVFSGDGITYWKNHVVASLSSSQRAQLFLSRGLTFTARVFARLAHQSNPIYREARMEGRETQTTGSS